MPEDLPNSYKMPGTTRRVALQCAARERRLRRMSTGRTDVAAQLPAKAPLLVAAKRTLDMITGGAALTEILESLCLAIDAQNPEMMSTVPLVEPDGTRLRPGAGPRVPRDWVGATAAVAIAPNVGSCGAAAFCKERVVTADVMTDPRWSGEPPRPSGAIAAAHGIRASWSQPLISRSRDVLGTFCMYYGQPRRPTTADLELIEDAARLAVIAIEGEQAQEALRRAFDKLRRDEQEMREITDAIAQTIAVLDPSGAPLYVNRALLDFTGLEM
ncbi:MAG TPA: GAF domain-containing protein, partial [Povalibacter sp.]|nr:GAF domain-containing protein [Povalibacter sp.]